MTVKHLAATVRSIPATSAAHSSRRILFVDDEPILRQLVSEVLTDFGYQVEIAEDGEAGWHTLHAVRHDPNSYHLLITDNEMPKLTGVELIKKARSERMMLPVILTSGTALTDIETFQLVDLCQPVALMPKPFSISELMQTVKEVLHWSNHHEEQPR